jgi:hypothetical protein
MKTHSISALINHRLVLLFVFLPALSCTTVKEVFWPPTQTPTPTATPTPTQTPTRIPLAERNLKEIVLQKSEEPEGFLEVDIPDVEQALAKADAATARALKDNLETGFLSMFSSNEQTTVYANLILVYRDSAFARNAFLAYREVITNNEGVDIPLIGDESLAVTISDSGLTGYVVGWRYHEAILELDYVGKADIGIDEMIRLARLIESRLETY